MTLKPPDAIEHCLNALSRNQRAVMAHGIVLVRAQAVICLSFPMLSKHRTPTRRRVSVYSHEESSTTPCSMAAYTGSIPETNNIG